MNGGEHAYIWIFLVGEASLLFAAVIVSLIPFITRKDLFFGVRIPESEIRDQAVIGLRKKYFIWMSLFSVITLSAGVIIYLIKESWVFLIILYQPFVLILAQFFVYLLCWKQAIKIKLERQWKVGFLGVSSTNQSSGKEDLRKCPIFGM